MGLRFDPIGGGMFKQALQAINEAEKKPIQQLEGRKKIEETKLKLFNDFKGRFTGFQSALSQVTGLKNFRELKVDLGDGKEILDVTLDKNKAQPGTYEIKIEEMATRSSMISNGFSNPEEANIGIGFIVVYPQEGDKYEVYVPPDKANLFGIADLINGQPDAPIRATVVKDMSDPEKPWRLIMNAKQDGLDRGVEFPEFYFLDGDDNFYMADNRDSQNAILQINDYPIEVEGNDVVDFLQGVNIHIKGANPDKIFTMTIAEDREKVAGKIKGVVEQTNKVLEFIAQQNKVDEKTDTRTMFTGDTSLQNMEFRLRNLLHEGFPAGDPDSEQFRFVHLHEVGVTFGKDGMLTFDEKKFNQAMERDFYGVAEAISGEYGFAYQLGEVMRMYTRPSDGVLATKERAMRSRIQQIDKNIEDKQRNVDRKMENLTQQFSRLQATLGNLQRQQQYVSATLGGGGGGNMVQQLLGG